MNKLKSLLDFASSPGLLNSPVNYLLKTPNRYMYTSKYFTRFLANLELTEEQHKDAFTKAKNIKKCLDDVYYPEEINPESLLLVGSYGKGTAIKPPSDIDIIYILPYSVFERIRYRYNNIQSGLLQEVKGRLQNRYPRTEFKADGQVIQVNFDSYVVEVVPAFSGINGAYCICDTNNGGSWKITDPVSENNAIKILDNLYLFKATHLIKMLKQWKKNCNIEVKSVALEILACKFIRQWEYKTEYFNFYGLMVRDFFNFLLKFENSNVFIPGNNEKVYLGNSWVFKCKKASQTATIACENDEINLSILSISQWQEIFGVMFFNPLKN